MQDAMVTARMQPSKKEAGNRVLESLGCSASQAINELYDYLLTHKSLPWAESQTRASGLDEQRLKKAMEWVDGLQVSISPTFAAMSTKDAKKHRLARQQSKKA